MVAHARPAQPPVAMSHQAEPTRVPASHPSRSPSVTPSSKSSRTPRATSRARDRILEAAYELFSRQGIRAVGIDSIVESSGVARMTLYRHFASKDALVLAFLERREERWIKDWLQGEVNVRATDPRDRLLAIFDVFDEWFQRTDFEGCSFINVLLEIAEPTHVVHQASQDYLARIRTFVAELAKEAGVADPDAFARQWHILMKGSIVAAAEGDHQAARRAQEMGKLLLDQQHALQEPPNEDGPSKSLESAAT